MQTNYYIIEEVQFSKVTFYSVVIENEEKSLFQDFISRMKNNPTNDYFQLIHHLTELGQIYGAKPERFRFENDAHAVPKFKTLKTLRLYCLRISDEIVILFNGDYKTAKKVQECPKTYPHFLLANTLSKKISLAIIEKELQIDFNNHKLIFDKNFYIEL